MTQRFIPKGGMCANCKHVAEDCSQLPFSTYPRTKEQPNKKPRGSTDEYIVVICKEFVRDDDN